MNYKTAITPLLGVVLACFFALNELALSQSLILNIQPRARNVEELTDESTFVVEALVDHTFTGQTVEGIREETDAVLKPVRVLKGPNQGLFVVSQIGGPRMQTKQYALMKPGERYLLFLTEEKPSRLRILPVRQGLARWGFADGGLFLSAFRIDGDRVNLNPGLPPSFMSLSSFAMLRSQIEAHLRNKAQEK